MTSLSTLERLDTPEFHDTLLMELLDESPCVEEDVDRLGRVIQSLEAEIAPFDDGAHVHVDVLSGSPCSFDWMEVESEAATESGAAMSSWYLEADDQFMALEYYGELKEYNNFWCYINGEESIEQVEEYGSLWE